MYTILLKNNNLFYLFILLDPVVFAQTVPHVQSLPLKVSCLLVCLVGFFCLELGPSCDTFLSKFKSTLLARNCGILFEKYNWAKTAYK